MSVILDGRSIAGGKYLYDSAAIRELVANAINSCKKAGGDASITTELRENPGMLKIIDSGTGMTKKEITALADACNPRKITGFAAHTRLTDRIVIKTKSRKTDQITCAVITGGTMIEFIDEKECGYGTQLEMTLRPCVEEEVIKHSLAECCMMTDIQVHDTNNRRIGGDRSMDTENRMYDLCGGKDDCIKVHIRGPGYDYYGVHGADETVNHAFSNSLPIWCGLPDVLQNEIINITDQSKYPVSQDAHVLDEAAEIILLEDIRRRITTHLREMLPKSPEKYLNSPHVKVYHRELLRELGIDNQTVRNIDEFFNSHLSHDQYNGHIMLKDALKDPLVIIRKDTPVMRAAAKKAFPRSSIMTWQEPKNYVKYSGKKYTACGYVYADEHLRKRKITPDTVMVYPVKGPAVHIKTKHLDSSCIRMKSEEAIEETRKMLEERFAAYMFVIDRPHLKNDGCITPEQFIRSVEKKKIDTSHGKKQCKSLLDAKNSVTLVYNNSQMTINQIGKKLKSTCVDSRNANELALAYILKHKSQIKIRSIMLDGDVRSGKDDIYDEEEAYQWTDEDGKFVLRENGHVLEISPGDHGDLIDDEGRIGTIEGGDDFKKSPNWENIAEARLVLGIEHYNDHTGIVDPEIRLDTDNERHGSGGIIYPNVEHMKELGMGDVSLGRLYANLAIEVQTYSQSIHGGYYDMRFGKGDDPDEMEDISSCGGIDSLGYALDMAYEEGFGQNT